MKKTLQFVFNVCLLLQRWRNLRCSSLPTGRGNTKATIRMPAQPNSIVKEGQTVLKNTRYENSHAVIEVGSGDYVFEVIHQ